MRPTLADERGILATVFAAFWVLAMHFIPTGDDWAWGSAEGVDRLRTHFVGYNGRYVANLVVLVLTRAGWITPLVIAAILTLTIHLVVSIADARSFLGYATASALFFTLPRQIWRESVSWLSGFTNYAISAAICLLFIQFLVLKRRNDHARRGAPTVLCAFIWFAVGASSALFMENATLFLVAASWLLVGGQMMGGSSFEERWTDDETARSLSPSSAESEQLGAEPDDVIEGGSTRRSHGLTGLRAASSRSLPFALGISAGAVVMFSNSAYRAALDGTSPYQSIGGGQGAGRHAA